MPKTVVTHYETAFTSNRKPPLPLRIAQVSDLHERNCDAFLPLLRKAQPDLIVVTGDTFERYDNRPQYDFVGKPVKKFIIHTVHFINFLLKKLMPKSKKPSIRYAKRFLREAAATAPVYMSLGNHEQKLLEKDYAFLREAGVTLLDNADTTVTVKGFRFTLGGMSCWDYESWLPTFLAKDGCKILLCHKPDQYIDQLTDAGIDLTLSGHTHGGQIRIGSKGMGFFVPGQGLFGKYAHGSFFGGRLIVSAGCSNTVAFPRLWNPRELVIIDVK